MKSSKLARTLTALAIALTLTAIAATTAIAALPEFKIVDKPQFTLKGGKIHWEEVGGLGGYGCEESSGEGNITGAKTATVKLKFNKCKFDEKEFQTEGDKKGEITTGTLPVELVYTSKAKHEVGLIFNYESPAAKEKLEGPNRFAAWEITIVVGHPIHAEIRSGAIAPTTPVNTKTESYSITLAISEEKQNPRYYESETGGSIRFAPEMSLLGGMFTEGGLSDKFTLTNLPYDGNFEIKA